MSSQKGNVTRTRAQRHQNAFSFRNDKFDTSAQTKKLQRTYGGLDTVSFDMEQELDEELDKELNELLRAACL